LLPLESLRTADKTQQIETAYLPLNNDLQLCLILGRDARNRMLLQFVQLDALTC